MRNVSVTALKGKVSLQLGAKEHQKVTVHNKPHTRALLRKIQQGARLCSGEEQQRRKQALHRASGEWKGRSLEMKRLGEHGGRR